ncbi:heparinase II/III family protein [Flavobacterium algicola]|uniref:heparinase II/III family protein n=1 Tax=Flavobacterium algicola TaxID=556529 RepID=UPI001EFE212E|nr:heparinase II/III family protein [Flavobacterium algicola]MCG9792934.1 heparinase II/III family protein [Flavobacterium algicola]
MKRIASLLPLFILFLSHIPQDVFSQKIPAESSMDTKELFSYLKPEVQKELGGSNGVTPAKLAEYFRNKFSERYFYDWKNNDARFKQYAATYPEAKSGHVERALDHLTKFPAVAQWKLPYQYQNGDPVNAYAMRHLARQHKMVDIAFYYNYQNKDAQYLNYFKNQLKSLNTALNANKYETIEDGNGIYEAFRSGYRILNWLEIHNMFLGEKAYSDEDQLITIATLLQHASSLYETNGEFVSGNHQTRGMSALAMLSILFKDFKDSDQWYDHSMGMLKQHLTQEINKDGFQFERSVHYHISDIDTYYFVYQLAKNSNIKVDEFWENKLKSLFVTLTKIGFPDKSAPVFSDDTDQPWAEKNNISGALTLGYLLFSDPAMGYFANNFVASDMFWYLNDNQLKMLDNIKSKEPQFTSVAFPETGYYFMRDGWKKENMMMAISNGLDPEKPDHQHGDMLGIQAMANGQVILPNYQVRYSLKDYEFFKNSMVKNVALVDNEMQGKEYGGNQGGSGFGKFKVLPNPKTIGWKAGDDVDFFAGSHDGFENIGVHYSRQVIYLKGDLWIIKDNFKSDAPHTYKQVWQGHYSLEKAPNLLRSTFNDGSGSDIYQLIATDNVITDGKDGKEWSVISKEKKENFSFITAIAPFKKFDDRIDEDKTNPDVRGWAVNKSNWTMEGEESVSLTKENVTAFFSVKKVVSNAIQIQFSTPSDVYVKNEKNKITIQSLSKTDVQLSYTNKKTKKTTLLKPGETIVYEIK